MKPKKLLMKQSLIQLEKEKRMFFVYSSPLPIPLNFAVHTRIVTVSPTWEIHRYEIHFFKNKQHKHLYIDYQEPSSWIGIFIRNKKPRYKSKLLYKTSWNNNSLAHKIVKFIEENIKTYKYKNIYYHIPWPNSNTFTQYIINQFPEIKTKLPRNAFGKNYK